MSQVFVSSAMNIRNKHVTYLAWSVLGASLSKHYLATIKQTKIGHRKRLLNKVGDLAQRYLNLYVNEFIISKFFYPAM